jgi:P4 family phage/plasmid primase-like protien
MTSADAERLLYAIHHDDELKEGSCTIDGVWRYEWRVKLDNGAQSVRISYRKGVDPWHNDCRLEDVDAKLLDYIRKKANTVATLRETLGTHWQDAAADIGRFFDDKRFVSKWVADEILADHHFLTFTDTEEVYHYDACDGIYRPGGDVVVQDCTQQLLGDRTTNHYSSEVLGYIRRNRFVHRDEIVTDPRFIQLADGTLNIATGERVPHSPDVPILTKLPVHYVPGRPCDACPEWLTFIKTTFDRDDIPLCQEIAGDLLYRDYWHKSAFMFIGPGDNGKSLFFAVLVAMLGDNNVATRSLQDIDKNRFAAADLYGKFANIHADISSDELRHTGMLKMLTGKDNVSAERKHQHAFTFVNYAKLLFSGNELPYTRDRTPAFFDRWILIEMPHVFKKHPDTALGELQADVELPTKLLAELPGILQWALGGLRRLLKNKDFTRSKASERVRERWIARTDSIRHFVENYVYASPGSRIEKDEFYNLYIDFCDEYGLIAVEKEKVGRRLPTLISTSTIRPGKKRMWKDISCSFASSDVEGEATTTTSLAGYHDDHGEPPRTPGYPPEHCSPENNSIEKIEEGIEGQLNSEVVRGVPGACTPDHLDRPAVQGNPHFLASEMDQLARGMRNAVFELEREKEHFETQYDVELAARSKVASGNAEWINERHDRNAICDALTSLWLQISTESDIKEAIINITRPMDY